MALALNVPSVDARQAEQEEAPAIHVVTVGETLSEIAQSYGLSLDVLMTYNGISDANAIRIGQRLRLPTPAPEATAPPHQTAPANGDDGDSVPGMIRSLNRTITVQQDDTLGRIALRYGVDLNALLALNGFEPDHSRLVIGQQLQLPATVNDLTVRTPDNVHTIQPGEALGLIAQSYGITIQQILAANRIGDPNTIRVGQELVIPGSETKTQAAPVGPARSGFFYHTVQPGETMSQLAQRFDTTPQAIVRYNGLPDESTIYYGLEIRIPYGPPQLPRRQPPTPYTGTEFIISITRQRCWVLQNGVPLYNWACSTGQGEWATRTGTFPIKTKLEEAKSSAYRLDMPFWLGLYDVGDYENGIHGLPVEWGSGQKLWDTLVGQPATFGCAMLLDEDAATLFNLSFIAMPVHIVD